MLISAAANPHNSRQDVKQPEHDDENVHEYVLLSETAQIIARPRARRQSQRERHAVSGIPTASARRLGQGAIMRRLGEAGQNAWTPCGVVLCNQWRVDEQERAT